MKILTFALGLLLLSTPAFAVAPLGVSGQGDTVNQYPPVIKVPHKQATKITGGTLFENGNNNMLSDPSFESTTTSGIWLTSVTSTAVATLTKANTATSELGKKHGAYTCAGGASGGVCTFYQDVATSKIIRGLVSLYVSSSSVTGVKLISRVNQAKFQEKSIDQLAEKLYKLSPNLGSTYTGIGVEVTVTAGQTITGTMDHAFVGAVDLKVDGAKVSQQTYLITQAGTSLTDTTSEIRFNLGTATITNDGDTSLITVSDDATGARTKFTANKEVFVNIYARGSVGAIGNEMYIYKNGALYTRGITQVQAGYAIGAVGNLKLLAGEYISVAQSAVAGNTEPLQVNFTATESGNSSTYSSLNADTDWQACTFASTAWTGLGSVTQTIRCKRQGGDLLMDGQFIIGAPSAVQAQIPLPVWNGVQLSTRAGLASVGRLLRSVGTATTVKDHILFKTGVGSVLYISYPEYSVATDPFIGQNGSNMFSTGASLIMENVRIPIEGWENSNFMVAQISGLESCANTYECTNTFSAKVSATGVVSDENVDFINGNCVVSATSDFTCTYLTKLKDGVNPLLSPMQCSIDATGGENRKASTMATTTAYAYYRTEVTTTQTDTAYPVDIVCQKGPNDYAAKTAEAVASDQNLRLPAITNAVMCYATIAVGNTISDHFGGCFASSSGTAVKTALFTTGYWAQKPQCWCDTSFGSSGVSACTGESESTSSVTSRSYISGAQTEGGPVTLTCIGQKNP